MVKTLPTRGLLRNPEFLLDAALAVGLAAAAVFLLSQHPGFALRGMPIPIPRRGGPEFVRIAASPLSYVLVALSFLPLALRRVYPGVVLAVVAIAVSWYQAVPNPPSLVLVGVLIALYSAGTLMERRRLVLWGGLAGALVLVTSLPDIGSELFEADTLRNLAVLLTAALLGDATRNRRAYVAEVEKRAIEAERTRDEEARRRVDEERLRIARELHDITAHSLAVIAVQSGAAVHVLDKDPAEARRSLMAIRQTSRESLQELRAMLGVLRSADDTGELPLAPAGGIARLGELVAPLEDAGLSVRVDVGGEVRDLPAVVDASAYRIVQESLTNVLRHAGKATVTISVRRAGETIAIEVSDDGASGLAPGEEGHGIAGMRERASALGGTFEAGPRAEGGWRVAVTLPVAGRQS